MKRAIFIIANNYRGNSSLRELNVGRDMVSLGGFFEHTAGYDIVEIVQDVPREVVLTKLDAVLKQLEPGDLLMIYFGGHGIQRQGSDHLLVLPPGKDDAAGALVSFLPVGDLRRRTEFFGLIRAIILDCCRNDDTNGASVTEAVENFTRRLHRGEFHRNVTTVPATVPNGTAAKGSFAIFCACSEDEVAPEIGSSGKGLFSTALITVLKRAHQAGQAMQLDDVLRAAVETEMHRIAAAENQDLRPQPWKGGNGTPEVLGGTTTHQPPVAPIIAPPAKVVVTPAAAPVQPFINTIGMKFVTIPAGEFMMGSPDDEAQRRNDETLHQVTLTRPFLMAITTVTQQQWTKVMGGNPSKFIGGELPVEQVSWDDAQAFIAKLSTMPGEENRRYRLPTEAEWEYACRAGTRTPFNFKSGGETISTVQANYDGRVVYKNGKIGEYREKTVPARSFEPNAWGLFQMHGNVWEWCEDPYGPYAGDEIDPGTEKHENAASRVLRGGSWFNTPQLCRSANRSGLAPGGRYHFIGFRVCLDCP